MYTRQGFLDKFTSSNWTVQTNDGTTLVAKNNVSGESFQGSPQAFRAMFSKVAPTAAEAVYDDLGRFAGMKNAAGTVSVLPAGVSITPVGNAVLRFAYMGSDSSTRTYDMTLSGGSGGGSGGGPDLTQPFTLAWLENYRTSGTPGQASGTYEGVPVPDDDGSTPGWSEAALGGAATRVCDIYVAGGTAPAGGRTGKGLFHPTTNNGYKNWLLPGAAFRQHLTDSQADEEVSFNFETRHPVTTYEGTAQSVPIVWTDIGRCVQFMRACAAALNINSNKIDVACRSRGSHAIWTALRPDMADASAPTFMGQQSTAIRKLYSMQCQVVLRNDRFADEYVVAGDRNAAKAANPTDPRLTAMPDILEMIPTTTSQTIFFLEHDLPWFQDYVTLATLNGTDKVHFPDAGRLFRDRMLAAGKGHQVVVNHSISPSSAATYARIAPWMRGIDAIPAGMTASAAEVLAIVTAKTSAEQLFYLKNDASGGFAATDGATGSGALVVGGTVGVLVDGAEGLANRLAGNAAVGTKAAMTLAGNRPTITSGWAMGFPAGGFLQVGLSNSSAEVWAALASGWQSGLRSRVNGNYKIGTDAMVAPLFACKVNGSISAENLRVYKQLGSELSGVQYPLV